MVISGSEYSSVALARKWWHSEHVVCLALQLTVLLGLGSVLRVFAEDVEIASDRSRTSRKT